MPKELEPPLAQPYVEAEISAELGYPSLSFSPVEWFDHLFAQNQEYLEGCKEDPIKHCGRQLSQEEFEQLLFEDVRHWIHPLHEMAEATYSFIDAGSGSSNGLVSYEAARRQLGLLRQRMIQVQIRPVIDERFDSDYDLTPNGQRLFSILHNSRISHRNLQTLANAEKNGFDLEAAKTELNAWGFLGETEGFLGLTNHPDLNWSNT
jgi:hypothetical protein